MRNTRNNTTIRLSIYSPFRNSRMMFSRKMALFVCLAAIVCLSSAFKERMEEDPPESRHYSFFPSIHRTLPRPISIFSKPPQSDDAKKTRPGILGHLGNVIHGGSIGIVIRPLAPIQGILEHAKKIIPGGKDKVGEPSQEKPPPPEKPKNEHWVEEGNKDQEEDWEMKKPDSDDDPNWGDIGEYPEDPNADIPIEDIIQPRIKPNSRPKRYIESKVYYVPLKYHSNGRTAHIKIKRRKVLRGSKKNKAKL